MPIAYGAMPARDRGAAAGARAAGGPVQGVGVAGQPAVGAPARGRCCSSRMLAHSLRLVLPSTTMPASRSRCTSRASCAGCGSVGQRQRPGRRGQVGGVDVVLDQDRPPVQRPDRALAASASRCAACSSAASLRVQTDAISGVHLVDPGQRPRHLLHRALRRHPMILPPGSTRPRAGRRRLETSVPAAGRSSRPLGASRSGTSTNGDARHLDQRRGVGSLTVRDGVRPPYCAGMTAGEAPTAGTPGAGDENRTESGLPFESVYGPDALDGLGPGDSSSASRGSTRSPAASTRRCTPAARGRCASTPASAPPRSPTSATSSSIANGTDRPVGRLRPADPDGLRLRRGRSRTARSARSASRSTRSRTCGCCSTASRSTRSPPR